MMVSIIIPAYGTPSFLDRAISSVFDQTFKDWELIIVDDNDPGTDARFCTESIVNRFLMKYNRVKYIRHDHNMNGAVARNTGFAIAEGKYISLLDSDDEYKPTRIEKCVRVMENSSEKIAGVYTGCEFRRKGKTFNRFSNVKAGNYLIETLACSFMLGTGSNIFVRKSVVDEMHGFDPMFLRQQDYEFMVRVFEKYSLEAIPEMLVIKNNENTNLPDIKKQIAIKMQYLDKFNYIIQNLTEAEVNYIYHKNWINIAVNAMLQNQREIAELYYDKAIKYGRLSFMEYLKKMLLTMHYILKKHE